MTVTTDSKGNVKVAEKAAVTNAILTAEHEEIIRLCGALAHDEPPADDEASNPDDEPGAAPPA